MTGRTTRRTNDAVIGAIRAHHEQLSEQLRERTERLHAAIPSGVFTAPREELLAWYRTELLPHAAAEERTLYAAGGRLDSTGLLVRGMVAEHEALIRLVARLDAARDPLEVVAAASSARELFAVHLAKENDLLLPALDEAGTDLAPLLDGMHELLGGHAAPAP